MYNYSKMILGCAAILTSIPMANATSVSHAGFGFATDHIACAAPCDAQLILVGKKFSAPKRIKVGVKGNQKVMTKSELRRKNPAVYRLYKQTEQVALDFHANGGGNVPLSCWITSYAAGCNNATWFCTILFDSLLSSSCGLMPPFIPRQP